MHGAAALTPSAFRHLQLLRALPGGFSDECLKVKPRSLCFPTEEGREDTFSPHLFLSQEHR